MNIPDDLRYSTDHEWAKLEDGLVRVGITDYAQDALGDVVFVQVPDKGASVGPGTSFGEIESTKSVSEIFSPVTGTVVAVNDEAVADPALVNSDPFGRGWLLRVEVVATGRLLSPQEYSDLVEA